MKVQSPARAPAAGPGPWEHLLRGSDLPGCASAREALHSPKDHSQTTVLPTHSSPQSSAEGGAWGIAGIIGRIGFSQFYSNF